MCSKSYNQERFNLEEWTTALHGMNESPYLLYCSYYITNIIIVTFTLADRYKKDLKPMKLAFYSHYIIVLVIIFATVECISKFWSRYIYICTITKQN